MMAVLQLFTQIWPTLQEKCTCLGFLQYCEKRKKPPLRDCSNPGKNPCVFFDEIQVFQAKQLSLNRLLMENDHFSS